MIKGGEVAKEEPKTLTAEEQAAIEQAAKEAAQKEAEAKALAEWTAYKAAQLSLASTKATSLTSTTAPTITTCVSKASAKPTWLKTEVDNSKKRVEANILALKTTIDPSERTKIEAEVTNEMNTLDGWVTPRVVDAKRILEVKIRDRKAANMDVKALEDELEAMH